MDRIEIQRIQRRLRKADRRIASGYHSPKQRETEEQRRERLKTRLREEGVLMD